MWGKGILLRSRLITFILASSTVLITISMVIYPKDAFDSAVMGLNLWWNVVFPALLPFFILSELLMGFGVVHFIGVLLEPLMRPIFNVPGVGAFALSMGLASGYPMDAVITCKFRKSNLCTAVEAERLLSFTNTADPLFMFGAVAVGMFSMPKLGPIIAIAHYISSFIVGIIFRFHGKTRDNITTDYNSSRENILLRAIKALYKGRKEDNRATGQLLGDAVKSSMNTILLIGGFIILFSVFLRIISIIGVTTYINSFFVWLMNLIGFNPNLAPSLVNGLFEMDLGTMAASQANADITQKVAIASAIIAWSGLCVHGQVASIVIESGIRMGPYMIARLLHAVIAAVLTIFFMNGQTIAIQNIISLPVFFNPGNTSSISYWWIRFTNTGYHIIIWLLLLISISILYQLIKNLINLKR